MKYSDINGEELSNYINYIKDEHSFLKEKEIVYIAIIKYNEECFNCLITTKKENEKMNCVSPLEINTKDFIDFLRYFKMKKIFKKMKKKISFISV